MTKGEAIGLALVIPLSSARWKGFTGLPRPQQVLNTYFPVSALSTSPEQGELGVTTKRRWGDTGITPPLNVPISFLSLQAQTARER